MFERWPWLPVVLLSGARDRDRLAADVLLTGVRAVVLDTLGRRRLRDVLGRVVGNRGEPVLRTAVNVATIQRIFGVLQQPGTEQPTVPTLARMAAMSPSHFSRTFRAVSGMAFRTYVRDLRLKRAHALLLGSDLSLTAVAIESGFYDLPHFDKAFRRRLGGSPHAFRRRYAQTSYTNV
jgi:transcriptional regulator GlxA family with amidase domain